MGTYSTEAHIIDLGTRLSAIHKKADDEFLKGFFVVTSEREEWAKYVNAQTATFPELIKLSGAAEIAMARYADGRGKINVAYKPMASTVQFLIGLGTGHPGTAGAGFWRLLRHGGAVAEFDASSPINQACSEVLKNYALVSVTPEGCALVKGKWWVFDYIRNSHLKCAAGVHLYAIIEIEPSGSIYFVKKIEND